MTTEIQTAAAERVARLRVLAAQSSDRYSEASATALLRYVGDLGPSVRPGIFVTLNGELRAIWENDEKEQIGIRFRDDGRLQYVLFRLHHGQLIETMGTEIDDEGMAARVDDLRLGRLWKHHTA